MRDSLDYAMGMACENLRERLAELSGDYDMQSIIVSDFRSNEYRQYDNIQILFWRKTVMIAH